jgi:Endoplasmic reticulum vesicle transporter
VTGPTNAILEGFKHRTSKSFLAQMGPPAIFFRYELSPIKIRYTMSYEKWSQYIVELCAIVGGLFVVAGIIESILRNGIGAIFGGNHQGSPIKGN